MSVTVRIPGPLRRITNGVDASGSAMTPPSVSAATDALSMNAYPPHGSPLRTAASALMPHGAAIAALGLFLLVGLAVFDDYGSSPDQRAHRPHAEAIIEYVLGDGDVALRLVHRTHGVAVILPLALAERALGLEDSRELWLARHLATHLLFLTGGLFTYLLAARLFDNKRTALLAMLLFLSHPRIYAHSFVNVNDASYLSMFAIALFLIHRVFAKDSLWAFALLGAGVGILTAHRIMGVALVPLVLAARGLDLLGRPLPGERKRALLTAGAFALAATLAAYAAWPYLWEDPVGRFIESVNHATLFQARILEPPGILTWFSATSPPFALLLGAVGAGAGTLLLRRARRPIVLERSSRFIALVVGSFVLPVLTVILLNVDLYNSWRHLYYIWAPFSLLATLGLRWIADLFEKPVLRALVYGAVGAGVAATLVSMIALHPNQQVYFNFFEDRVTPDKLSDEYVLDNWNITAIDSYKFLLREEPSSVNLAFNSRADRPLALLREEDRRRISIVNPSLADFSVMWTRPEKGEETLHVVEVYNNVLSALVKEQPEENPFPAAYDAALSLDPVVRSVFDLYTLDRVLAYVREPCEAVDLISLFVLRFYPASPDDLPEEWRWAGYEEESFRFLERGSLFDGKCAALAPLPNYPVLNVHAYQFNIDTYNLHWEVFFPLAAEAHYAAYEAAVDREPDARSMFDLYLDKQARTLTYVKEPCAPSDVERKFFLHIAPERVTDLPDDRRESGFDNLDFEYFTRGVLFNEKCAAVLPLPDYAVERLRTGQFVGGEGEAWAAAVAFGE